MLLTAVAYLQQMLSLSLWCFSSFSLDKSAARFYYQMAAWVSDMFFKFPLVKSHKIANNSATTEAREK